MLKNTYIVPSTNATIAICANERRWSAIATTMLVTAPTRTMSETIIIRLRWQAVDGGACQEAEERPGEDAGEADEAGLNRRVRDREDEQRVRDPRRLGADRRKRLPDLQQNEVAVLSKRYELSQAASASFDLCNLPPPRQQICRGEEDGTPS